MQMWHMNEMVLYLLWMPHVSWLAFLCCAIWAAGASDLYTLQDEVGRCVEVRQNDTTASADVGTAHARIQNDNLSLTNASTYACVTNAQAAKSEPTNF